MNNQDYEVYLKAVEHLNHNETNLAIELLNELSKKRNKKAIFELAKVYYNIGELKKSINLFVLSGESGYIESYYYLGLIFLKLKDYQESYRYFLIGRNYPKSNLYLGILELKGRIKSSSKKRAFLYFLSGSKKNVLECDYYLGICYQNGYGIKKNFDKMTYYFERAKRNQTDISLVEII